MSEFMEKHSVSKFIGSPPGYVGYEEGGQLTERVKRSPYSVILLDEIEKAHHDVFNILLQVFEDGQLTDGLGNTVDFKNTILIMTSNLGTRQIGTGANLGFHSSEAADEYRMMEGKVMTELKKTFNPEFLNRVDDIVVFHALSRESILQIIDILLKDVRKRLVEKDMDIVITQKAKEFLANEGYSPTYGARPLKRVIQKYIENSLSEELLSGRFGEGSMIKIDLDENKIIFGEMLKSKAEKN
jgi:ATP-dependent Clp protease ATP-binding subunit ClpC